jgi:hypothetical protein
LYFSIWSPINCQSGNISRLKFESLSYDQCTITANDPQENQQPGRNQQPGQQNQQPGQQNQQPGGQPSKDKPPQQK